MSEAADTIRAETKNPARQTWQGGAPGSRKSPVAEHTSTVRLLGTARTWREHLDGLHRAVERSLSASRRQLRTLSDLRTGALEWIRVHSTPDDPAPPGSAEALTIIFPVTHAARALGETFRELHARVDTITANATALGTDLDTAPHPWVASALHTLGSHLERFAELSGPAEDEDLDAFHRRVFGDGDGSEGQERRAAFEHFMRDLRATMEAVEASLRVLAPDERATLRTLLPSPQRENSRVVESPRAPSTPLASTRPTPPPGSQPSESPTLTVLDEQRKRIYFPESLAPGAVARWHDLSSTPSVFRQLRLLLEACASPLAKGALREGGFGAVRYVREGSHRDDTLSRGMLSDLRQWLRRIHPDLGGRVVTKGQRAFFKLRPSEVQILK